MSISSSKGTPLPHLRAFRLESVSQTGPKDGHALGESSNFSYSGETEAKLIVNFYKKKRKESETKKSGGKEGKRIKEGEILGAVTPAAWYLVCYLW